MPVLPTEAQVQDSIGKAVLLYERQRVNDGTLASFNYDEIENEFLASLQYLGDASPAPAAAVAGLRAVLDSAFATAPGVLDPLWVTYGRQQGLPVGQLTPDAVRRALFDIAANGAVRVKSRVFTFGNPAAGGGNVGDTEVFRLTKDAYGFDIEAGVPETKELVCTQDAQSGARAQAEVFELTGAAAAKDGILPTGSGIRQQVKVVNAGDSRAVGVRNPSFDEIAGTITDPTDIPGWEANVAVSATTFALDEDDFFRTSPGVVTPRALVVKGNCILRQSFADLRALSWSPGTPIFVRLAFNREVGLSDGTLTIRWGASSKAVVLAAQTGWQKLKIDLDEDAWLLNWNEDDGALEIELSGHTTGTLLVDDVVVCAMTPVDDRGSWLVVDGGEVPALRGDSHSFGDAAVEGAILQRWFARVHGLYWPHSTGGGITWADPT